MDNEKKEKRTEFYDQVCELLIPKINSYTGKFIPPIAFADNLTFALYGVFRTDIIKIDTYIEENVKHLQNTSFMQKLEILFGYEKAKELEALYLKESDCLRKKA